MLRFFSFLARLAILPVIGALLMPTVVESLASRGLMPNMSKLLGRTGEVLASPVMFGFAMFLLGWWCATIYLELNDRRDHDPTLLERSRLKAVLGRTRHALRWWFIPKLLRNYQTNRTNEALKLVEFAMPGPLEPEGETSSQRDTKAHLAYYEIMRILIKRLDFDSARKASSTVRRLLFKEEQAHRTQSKGRVVDPPNAGQ